MKSIGLHAKTVSARRGVVWQVKEKAAMDKSETLKLANGLPMAVGAREDVDGLTRSSESHDTNKNTSRGQEA